MNKIGFYFWICTVLLLLLQNVDCKKKKKKKVWEFRFSLDGFPANYINKTTNQLEGQSVDMVRKICDLAGKKCNLSYVDRVDCWNDVNFRSKVLDNGEADVCANLVESPDRNIFYRFPNQSIYRIPNPILIRRPGDTRVTLESLKTCNDFILAYPGLTALNRDCLIAAGMFVKEDGIFPVMAEGSIVAAIREIATAIIENRTDVGLVIPRLLFPPAKDQVEIVGESPCLNTLIGLNMMVKKDDAMSTEFINWWNPTLKRFICGFDAVPISGHGLHARIEAEISAKISKIRRKRKSNKKLLKKLKKKILDTNDYDYKAFCELMRVKYDNTDPLCFTPGVDANCPGNPIPPKPTGGGPIDPCQ